MPHWHTKITSAAPDDQPPLEPLKEVPAGEFNDAMMDNEYIINFFLKRCLLSQNPLPFLCPTVLRFCNKNHGVGEFKILD